MDKPVIGSGKLLIGKDGKLLVQGDGKVVSSKPSELHQLVTQTNADGTSNIFMVPSEGTNKGKFFLVMPKENQKQKKISDVSSNITSNSSVSETFSKSSETMPENSGPQSMSKVLKNLAKHVSTESSAPGDKPSNSVESSTNTSNSFTGMSTVTNIPTSSVSSLILTGGACTNVKQSSGCESRTDKFEHVQGINIMPSTVQSAPSVALPSVDTVPVSPLLSMPSLPSSQSVLILPSGSISVLPMATGKQPLLAALNAPPLQALATQTSKTTAVTSYQYKPNILGKITSSQPSTAMVTSCRTTITTASNRQPFTNTRVSASSKQVPLVPVIINTNQINTSAPNFLPNATTSVTTSSQSLSVTPELMIQTKTTYSPTFLQAPLVAASTSSPLIPVMIAPKLPNGTAVSNVQQTPVTNSPLLLTAQQAANLLSMSYVSGTKVPANNSNNSFMKTIKNLNEKCPVNTVQGLTSSQESALHVDQTAGLSTTRQNSDLTTTTYSALTRSNSQVTGVATSAQDRKISTPVVGSVDGHVLNKPQEFSNDQGLAYNASTSLLPTSSKTTAVCTENTVTTVSSDVTRPTLPHITHGTCLSGVTPMLLFSHNAARNLKPNGLPDPFVKQGCKTTPTADATALKQSPQDAVSTGSLPAYHQGLPSALEVKPKGYTQSNNCESLNINSKKFIVVSVPVSKDSPLLQRANSGNSAMSLATGTSSYISMSCDTSSPVTTKLTPTVISSTASNNITVKSSPLWTIVPQTANANNTARILSYPTDSNFNICLSSLLTQPSQTVLTCAGSTRSTNYPSVVPSVMSDCVTSQSERKGTNDQARHLNEVLQKSAKPQIIVCGSRASKLTRDNSAIGNLVSIVPSSSPKKTCPPMMSLLTTSDPGYTRVVRTTNSGNNVKNDSKPDVTRLRKTEKDTDTATLNSAVHPISKMPRFDELPIRIDSVFSLSTENQTSKPESVYGAECSVSREENNLNGTQDMSNTRTSASFNVELSNNTSSLSTAANMDLFEAERLYRNEADFDFSDETRKQYVNTEGSPNSSEPSVSPIWKEFDHLSNFNGVILPDEAITESKIFSPCYVVLETLRMHGGTMEGINTRCSRTCRQRFVSRKSNIRLAIQKKKVDLKQVEANHGAPVPGKTKGKKRKAAIIKDNESPGLSINSDGINIKKSRDISHVSLGTTGHAAAQVIENDSTTNGKIDGKQKTPSSLSMPVKDDTSKRVMPTSSQTMPETKKVPNTEKFYLIRIDGKTVLIPYMNAGGQRKAFILNENEVNLGSYTIKKSYPANNASQPIKVVLPRVSTPSSSTAASSVGTSVMPTTKKLAQDPTKMEVKVKPEPVTYGYGDESKTGIQPPVIVKQERLDRGYSDEPPKLERMDTKPPKRTSHELKSKEHAAPELTAEKIVPQKIQKVMSKEERITSLKELLKKQEKDLEAIRKRRVAESTPVDLDL